MRKSQLTQIEFFSSRFPLKIGEKSASSIDEQIKACLSELFKCKTLKLKKEKFNSFITKVQQQVKGRGEVQFPTKVSKAHLPLFPYICSSKVATTAAALTPKGNSIEHVRRGFS